MADTIETLRARLVAMQALAAKAAKGPYHVVQSNNATPFIMHEGGTDWTDYDDEDSVVVAIPAMYQNALANAKMMAAAPDLVTHLTDALALAESQAAELTAYKRAKAENDERFMLERDEARSRLNLLADSIRDGLAGSGHRPASIANEDLATVVAAMLAERDEARAELTAIRTALGDGADEAAWMPGETVAQAVERLRGERAAVVAYLRALPESHRVGGQVVGTGYSPAAVRALTDAADAIERGDFWPKAGALADDKVKP